MNERKKRTTAGDKTICLPIPADVDYAQLVEDTDTFRADRIRDELKAVGITLIDQPGGKVIWHR
jgi:cysteinyl-tRNA synthetase